MGIRDIGVSTMKLHELLEKDIDITVFNNYTDYFCSFVGPCHLTDYGRCYFYNVLDLNVTIDTDYEYAEVEVEDDYQEKRLRELLEYFAGFCSEEKYARLFEEETPKKAISKDKLYLLCNRYQWFTAGDIDQYNKLFQKCEAGASLEELALIIWLCSSNATEKEILHILQDETDQH